MTAIVGSMPGQHTKSLMRLYGNDILWVALVGLSEISEFAYEASLCLSRDYDFPKRSFAKGAQWKTDKNELNAKTLFCL